MRYKLLPNEPPAQEQDQRRDRAQREGRGRRGGMRGPLGEDHVHGGGKLQNGPQGQRTSLATGDAAE